MLNVVGYATKKIDGRCKGTLRTVSIDVAIDILPNMKKAADSQPDFRVVTEGINIGAGWAHKSEASNKEYVSLSIAAPKFGPEQLYGNFGKAERSGGKDLYAVIWNPAD
jgi:uncharacterized protein (DUF736 family)